MQNLKILKVPITIIFLVMFSIFVINQITIAQVNNPQTGGIGLQGQISSDPPTTAPTISTPTTGQVLSSVPQEVRGLCTNGLLVKLFKNNVFSGSALCQNSSFSIIIDLFSGTNDLVARHYDDLDQAGPDSNIVSVIFNDSRPRSGPFERITLTSSYARLGSNPNQELKWPVVISGGFAPYAISVDWGDGQINDGYVVRSPGSFNISNTYKQSGFYRVLIKATDTEGNIGFLQVTSIVNGELSPSQALDDNGINNNQEFLWQPLLIVFPLIIYTFYLGKKYMLSQFKKKLAKGENPFK